MKIAIINASTQKQKNKILYDAVYKVCPYDEIINFGVCGSDDEQYSYVHTAISVALLLNSGAIDFVVTGCSSGMGMMLACNSMPNVFCGYSNTPQEAYLFGRINNGNAMSFVLGEAYGYQGDDNLYECIKHLFEEPMGIGYPPESAIRKQADANLVKTLKQQSQVPFTTFLEGIDTDFLSASLFRKQVDTYVLEHGKDEELKKVLINLHHKYSK